MVQAHHALLVCAPIHAATDLGPRIPILVNQLCQLLVLVFSPLFLPDLGVDLRRVTSRSAKPFRLQQPLKNPLSIGTPVEALSTEGCRSGAVTHLYAPAVALTLCRHLCAHCCPVLPLILFATADHLRHGLGKLPLGNAASLCQLRWLSRPVPVAQFGLPFCKQAVLMGRPGASFDSLAVYVCRHWHGCRSGPCTAASLL